MRTFRVMTVVIALTTIGVMPAAAQDPGNVGLTMTSESGVGLTIEVGKRVAIRPEVAFTRSTLEGGIGGDRTTTAWSPGMSLLFHVKSWDATRLYLAPRWTYSRSTNNVDDGTSSGHAVSGMIGAQHNITNRFAAFGEVGLRRSTSNTESQLSSSRVTAWSIRSMVGAILFF